MMIFVLQDGWSPLLKASYEGHLDVVKTLIEAGANVSHTNKVGKYMHCCTFTCTCTYSPLASHARIYTCLHVCHNDAMGTSAASLKKMFLHM